MTRSSLPSNRPSASMSVDDGFAGLVAVQALVLAAVLVDRAVGVQDVDDADLGMPLLAGVVVRIVGRRHLHAAGAERRVGEQAVGDDRDVAVHQRDRHRACRSGACSARRTDARTRRCRRASFRAGWCEKRMNSVRSHARLVTGYLNVQKPPLASSVYVSSSATDVCSCVSQFTRRLPRKI